MAERRICGYEFTISGDPCGRWANPDNGRCGHHNPEALARIDAEHRLAIDALLVTGSYGGAAKLMGIPRNTLIDWRNQYPVFGVMCEDAIDEALEAGMGTLYQRAFDGQKVTEDTWEATDQTDENGQPVMRLTKRVEKVLISDKAAAMILAARKPEFRAGYVEPPPAIRKDGEERARRMIENPDTYKAVASTIRDARDNLESNDDDTTGT